MESKVYPYPGNNYQSLVGECERNIKHHQSVMKAVRRADMYLSLLADSSEQPDPVSHFFPEKGKGHNQLRN